MSSLVADQRQAVADLVEPAQSDVRSLLADLQASIERARSKARADAAIGEVVEAVPLVVEPYAQAAATVAADSYDEARDTVGARGRFVAEPAQMDAPALVRGAQWAATPALEALDADAKREAVADMLRRLLGPVQSAVADTSRVTIVGASIEDPAALGWRRYAGAKACDFCVTLAMRGAVYREATAHFASHHHCHCTCGPAWNEDRVDVDADFTGGRKTNRGSQDPLKRYLSENRAEFDAYRASL